VSSPLAQVKAHSYLTRLVASYEQDVWTAKSLYQLGLYHQQSGKTPDDQALALDHFRNAASRCMLYPPLLCCDDVSISRERLTDDVAYEQRTCTSACFGEQAAR
jgi:hypothetical protein